MRERLLNFPSMKKRIIAIYETIFRVWVYIIKKTILFLTKNSSHVVLGPVPFIRVVDPEEPVTKVAGRRSRTVAQRLSAFRDAASHPAECIYSKIEILQIFCYIPYIVDVNR